MQNLAGCHERNMHDGNAESQTARDKCPPPIQDPDKTEFKVGDMV